MSYKKFDAPAEAVSQSVRKPYDAFPNDAMRRAILAVSNRVLSGGASGTATSMIASNIGTGTTGGIKIGNSLRAVINGRFGSIAAQAELGLPTGTQANATYVKYLVSSGFGSSGTVTAGNEGASSTAAYLPDCPKDHVALGYFEFYTNSASSGWPRTKAGDPVGKCSGTGGTGGTIVSDTMYDLIHMPIWEE